MFGRRNEIALQTDKPPKVNETSESKHRREQAEKTQEIRRNMEPLIVLLEKFPDYAQSHSELVAGNLWNIHALSNMVNEIVKLSEAKEISIGSLSDLLEREKKIQAKVLWAREHGKITWSILTPAERVEEYKEEVARLVEWKINNSAERR